MRKERSPDLLGDPSSLVGLNVGASDLVQQQSFSCVYMAKNTADRRPEVVFLRLALVSLFVIRVGLLPILFALGLVLSQLLPVVVRLLLVFGFLTLLFQLLFLLLGLGLLLLGSALHHDLLAGARRIQIHQAGVNQLLPCHFSSCPSFSLGSANIQTLRLQLLFLCQPCSSLLRLYALLLFLGRSLLGNLFLNSLPLLTLELLLLRLQSLSLRNLRLDFVDLAGAFLLVCRCGLLLSLLLLLFLLLLLLLQAL
mmetsp:Transcript_37691/g.82458  ORF Transcript_37691/g.82458 Transcript_37691/m.82458 type:complete len:253 (-) Transcript_37691:746-1504(-)